MVNICEGQLHPPTSVENTMWCLWKLTIVTVSGFVEHSVEINCKVEPVELPTGK